MKFIDKRAFAFLIVLAYATTLFFSPSIIYFNTTPSIPIGLYLRIPATTVRKGDIVSYIPPQEVVNEIIRLNGEEPKQTYFLKYVGALEGDSYTIDQNTKSFIVNGEYIGSVRDKNGKDLPMPNLNGTHIVAKDEFLPIAPNPASFDGRYTGTVPIHLIISRAIPLLTF